MTTASGSQSKSSVSSLCFHTPVSGTLSFFGRSLSALGNFDFGSIMASTLLKSGRVSSRGFSRFGFGGFGFVGGHAWFSLPGLQCPSLLKLDGASCPGVKNLSLDGSKFPFSSASTPSSTATTPWGSPGLRSDGGSVEISTNIGSQSVSSVPSPCFHTPVSGASASCVSDNFDSGTTFANSPSRSGSFGLTTFCCLTSGSGFTGGHC
mmetsp:Transcript_22297/g.55215  ORF Transcript_22297/g.55215 Transcript_22297/m.55215 type:complete len:207 (-) Transcript_22297:45-665(-)